MDYKEIKAKPKSIAKDYYIYRLLLEGNASKEELNDLYNEVSRMNPTLKSRFAKKIDVDFNEVCKPLSVKSALEANQTCLIKLLTPQFVEPLSDSAKTALLEKIKKESNFTASWIIALKSKEPFKTMQKNGLAEEFLKIFNDMPKSYKQNLNFALDKKFLYKLESSPNSYETFVKYIIFNADEFPKPAKSLIYAPKSNKLTHHTLFYLGINALKSNNTKLAEELFDAASKNAYFRSDMDKSLFFSYLASNNQSTLLELSGSFDINIYSLYAKEKFGTPAKNIIFLSSSRQKAIHKFNMQDPFEWRLLLNKIKDMEKREMEIYSIGFDAQDTLPVYAFLLERLSNYKYHYFIIPFEEYLSGIEDERKALILALARQESRFIPSAISTSYAIGMTQFMPNVALDIAKKERWENFDLDDMFQPQIAYNFTDIHLNYLNTYLYHPLFVAYAYNGGIGYTKRMLQADKLFKSGKYEPFLSIELLHGDESREYGKKVLANYVIYMENFDKKVSIKELLEILTQPSQTDKFRL
ncbi:MAG: transglycosylase SLT domain-containing protein [Campylobacteraceae bacterium]|nr:transglycosylase SLT domain-containing protein [Campylobacteraceae bacterium]